MPPLRSAATAFSLVLLTALHSPLLGAEEPERALLAGLGLRRYALALTVAVGLLVPARPGKEK